ncbi:MAG: ABC transporter permease subunit [Lewinellaceae bacterium]|nr:ABC transporter permease subunit [Lewinellaceae bacterium]
MKLSSTILLFLTAFYLQAQNRIVVGSKHFNESYILSEIIAQLLESNGFEVIRKTGLGGTTIAFDALKNGEIDVYPEYSGTIGTEILKATGKPSLEEIESSLHKEFNLSISKPLGFNNTYAIVLLSSTAERLNLMRISDLQQHKSLRGAVSYEFLERADGWRNLSSSYHLEQDVTGIEHGLAYQALANDKIDFTDAYSTDGEIPRYKLKTLKDGKSFFPKYEAVSLFRNDLPEKAKTALSKLDELITDEEMQAMNAMALYQGKEFATIAHEFLLKNGLSKGSKSQSINFMQDMWEHVMQHLWLTFISVLLAVVIAVPLGIYLYRHQRFMNVALYTTGIFQTIPSIALLALMISFLGIGVVPSMTALCIYALLPILRNTISGLKGVDPNLKTVATAIGLNRNQRLRKVELPLSLPYIINGIRIAAVINVGTATLAAFIGAGGLGEYIVTGLALNNTSIILKGAIPAALLAITIELIFELIEKTLIPKHLQQSR